MGALPIPSPAEQLLQSLPLGLEFFLTSFSVGIIKMYVKLTIMMPQTALIYPLSSDRLPNATWCVWPASLTELATVARLLYHQGYLISLYHSQSHPWTGIVAHEEVRAGPLSPGARGTGGLGFLVVVSSCCRSMKVERGHEIFQLRSSCTPHHS